MSKDPLSKDSEKKEPDTNYQTFGIVIAVIIIVALMITFTFKDKISFWFKKMRGKNIDELDDNTKEDSK